MRYPQPSTFAKDGLLPDPLIACLNAWQAIAREEKPVVCPLVFEGNHLLIRPHGAGKGQWRWVLNCPSFTLTVSRGRLNGVVAQVRFIAPYLWSSEDETYRQDIWPLLVNVSNFLSLFFTSGAELMDLQVSELHVCANVTGWD